MTVTEDLKAELKVMIREESYPYFEDSELSRHIASSENLNAAAYKCLIIKAEDTTLSVSGLNCGDTSKYFLRLARSFRPSNSRVLTGG